MSKPPTDYSVHNAMVSELWQRHEEGTNERVPIHFAIDEQWRLPRYGCSFRDYYHDPELQWNVQLQTEKMFRETFWHDREMGPPAHAWSVAPVSWTAEREYFGASVHYQDNDYAWAEPLPMGKGQLVDHVRSIEPKRRAREERIWWLYSEMARLAKEREFEGKPVRVGLWIGTHGLFTIAAELRGLEQFCLDLVEDPAFAEEYLAAVTDALIGRMLAWDELLGRGNVFPIKSAWGGPDDSLQLISTRTYRERVLHHHQRMYSRMTTGPRTIHLCGHAQHHFKALHDELGITIFDGPGPFVNIGTLRDDIGAPIQVNAQMNHTVLITGLPSAIEAMIAGILTPGAKRGKLNLMGLIVGQTPPEHVALAYEYGKRYGGRSTAAVGNEPRVG